MINCKNCNALIEDGMTVCRWCGAKVSKDTKIEKSKRKKAPIILIGGSVLVVIILVILLIKGGQVIHFGKAQGVNNSNLSVDNKHQDNPGLTTSPIAPTHGSTKANTTTGKPSENIYYLKGDEVVGGNINQFDPRTVIRNLFHTEEQMDSVTVSADGMRLFYPNNHDLNADSVSMFATILKGEQNNKVQIDTHINGYTINEDGTKIFYLKEDDLYVSDMLTTEKIDSEVSECWINTSGDWIIYLTNNGTMYQKREKQSKQLIAENISLQYVSHDMEKIYYIVNDTLFLLEDGKELKELASKVSTVLYVNGDGTVYYKRSTSINPKIYLDDDLAVSDAAMKVPLRDDYKDNLSYNKAVREFEKKQIRDQWREQLTNMFIDGMQYSLYCYSEGQNKLVSDYCVGTWSIIDQASRALFGAGSSNNSPSVLIYSQLKDKNNNKIKMSELDTTQDIFEPLSKISEDNLEYNICIKGQTLKKIGEGYINNFIIDSKGKGFYYIKTVDATTNIGDLFYRAIEDSVVSDPVKINENVYTATGAYIGNEFLYFKNVNESEMLGDMYLGNRKIDNNVSIYKLLNNDFKNNTFVYLTNLSNDYKEYTMMLYKNGSTEKIADRVSSYYLYNDQRIAYISSDLESSDEITTKTLYLYDRDGITKLLDRNVDRIVRFSKSFYVVIHGIYNYYW